MKLELYYRPTCPYSLKVLKFIHQNAIKLDLMDISDEKNRQELLRVGGKQQVPCLFIDGKPMYESDDIVDWLKEHFKI